MTADVGDIVIAEYGVSAANANVADTTETVLLTIRAHPTNTNHDGGQMSFGPRTAACTSRSATAAPANDPHNHGQRT